MWTSFTERKNFTVIKPLYGYWTSFSLIKHICPTKIQTPFHILITQRITSNVQIFSTGLLGERPNFLLHKVNSSINMPPTVVSVLTISKVYLCCLPKKLFKWVHNLLFLLTQSHYFQWIERKELYTEEHLSWFYGQLSLSNCFCQGLCNIPWPVKLILCGPGKQKATGIGSQTQWDSLQ